MGNSFLPDIPYPLPLPLVTPELSDEDKQDVLKRLAHLEHRVRNMEQTNVGIVHNLAINTAVTKQVKEDTASLVEIFTFADQATKRSARLFIKVMNTIKWFGGIALAITSILYLYNTFKHGGIVPPSLGGK